MLDVYLGYEGEISDIFEKDVDWAAAVGGVGTENPDIEAVKAIASEKGAQILCSDSNRG